MKILTDNEMDQVTGGWGFIVGYIGGHVIDAALRQASNTENMFQNTNGSLPYNRL
jgi:bacteriocin-like protein